MNYSIIVTFYQNMNMLWNCIHTLIDTIHNIKDIEVVIVNDNPTIKLNTEFTDKKCPVPLKIVQNSQNRGHSGACQAGVENSQGKYLIFLDCDIIVSKRWFKELNKTFFSHSNCGAAMSTILDFSNNQIVYAGMELYKSESIKPFQGAYCQHPFLAKDHASQIITAGCMMVCRSTYEHVGGFDDKFFNSCNDLDFSMKLNAANYQNYVSANSIVYHRGDVSGEIRFASHIYARSYFFQKWSNEIKADSKALSVLAELYKQQYAPEGDYLVIDFSSSLFSNDYINCLCQTKNIFQINNYRVRCSQSKIIITDYLRWDICQLNVPILYFSDDYRSLLNNYLWFHLRADKKDIIADRNGNLIQTPNYYNDWSKDIADT